MKTLFAVVFALMVVACGGSGGAPNQDYKGDQVVNQPQSSDSDKGRG